MLVTWPVAARIGTALPGVPGDVEAAVWELWWFRHALIGLHGDPGVIDVLYFPSGAYSPLPLAGPHSAAIGLPLLLVLTPLLVHNLQFLLSFALNGFCAYLLCLSLSRSRLAAFIGGVIYAFSPYILVNAIQGHLSLIQLQWLPLSALYLLRLLAKPTLGNAVLAGIFWALVSAVHMTYAVYLGIFFPLLFMVYWAVSSPTAIFNRNFLLFFGLAGAVAFLFLAPLYLPILQQAVVTKGGHLQEFGTVRFSADLLGFFLPSPHNPFYAKIGSLQALSSKASGETRGMHNTVTVFLGYFPILLALLGFWAQRRRLQFWLVAAAVYGILALGPLLKVAGNLVEYSVDQRRSFVVLPYALLTGLPVIGLNRVPSRLDAVVTLALCVLAAFGARSFLRRLATSARKWPSYAALTLATAFIMAEYIWIFPFPTTDASVPPFYDQVHQDSADYAILDLPLSTSASVFATPLYFQTHHAHKIVGGYLSRVPPSALAQAQDLADLAMPQDVFVGGRETPRRLAEMGIRYVVLHKEKLAASDRPNPAAIAGYLASWFGPAQYEDAKITVFETRLAGRPEPNQVRVSLGPGWYSLEFWDGRPTRWVASESLLKLDIGQPSERMSLALDSTSFKRERKYRILVDGRDVGEFVARPESFQRHRTREFASNEQGEVVIKIVAEPPCRTPMELGEDTDARCLALAFQNIEVEVK